jgi:hypothetical protein
MRYKEGDVVLVPYPWKDENGEIQTKNRPAVVYRIESESSQLMIKCTHINRSGQFPGKWVLQKSEQGRKMGINEDTFIHYTDTLIIPERFVIKLIGYCPFIEDIIDFHEQ